MDWEMLAVKMNALAEANDIRWLVSTSRRTGARAEGILRKHLDPDTIARVVWWAEKPERLMADIRHAGSIFLGRMTPEAVGDYVAGPNHVLPTGRRARFAHVVADPGQALLDFEGNPIAPPLDK